MKEHLENNFWVYSSFIWAQPVRVGDLSLPAKQTAYLTLIYWQYYLLLPLQALANRRVKSSAVTLLQLICRYWQRNIRPANLTSNTCRAQWQVSMWNVLSFYYFAPEDPWCELSDHVMDFPTSKRESADNNFSNRAYILYTSRVILFLINTVFLIPDLRENLVLAVVLEFTKLESFNNIFQFLVFVKYRNEFVFQKSYTHFV